MTTRGRARGRGRGTGGPAPSPVGVSSATAVAAPVAPTAGGAAGRGRGRGRGQVAPPLQQMAAMNIHQPARAEGEPPSRFADKVYKPANVESTIGSSGVTVQVGTNYFNVTVKDNMPFYQYRVDFLPEQDNVRKRKAMVHKVEVLNGSIFDGTLLYHSAKFDPVSEHDVQDREGCHIRIILKLTQEVDWLSEQGLQVINLRFKQVAERYMGLERIGRDYYNPSKVIAVPQHKIEILPGYDFSVRKFSGGILIGVDIKHKIIRTSTVLQFMNDVITRGGPGAKTELRKQLVGQIVMTRYNNKTYKVDDIAFDKKASDMVELKGVRISYIDYYKKTYPDVKIRDTQQPLLISRVKGRESGTGEKTEQEIHLVPEVCYMTGISEVMRSDYKIMQDLAVYTRQDPQKRTEELLKWRETIAESPEAVNLFNGLNIELGKAPIETKARELPKEVLLIKDNNKYPCEKPGAFDNITRKKFVISSAPGLGQYVVICTQRDLPTARAFVETCAKVGPPAGINIGATTSIVPLQSDSAREYIKAIREVKQKDGVQIVVCIVPNDRKDRYDAIKQQTCIDGPIPSQVIVAKSLNPKKLMSVTTKVVMQMNAKLGGELWAVNIPMKNVMYVGIDTYHDAGTNRSVGAFVASMNSLCTRYYSKVTWQSSKQEMISELDLRMTDALKNYFQMNQCYPEKIIIFRDGVGDGQLEVVKEMELKNIKEAIARLPGDKPELIFVVVSKRIPQRFFQKMGNRLTNVKPGTVVDTTLTKDTLFDFFLVPQVVRQGTVTPTHYNVLEFNTTLTPDRLQMIAFKLCHVYYNWTGTIKVPAPCQYAHKLAFLVGESLHKDPSPDLDNLLFYL